MEKHETKRKRSFFDRRSGQDRRIAYNIDYFLNGGVERRRSSGKERRTENKDRRKEWIKISTWSSFNLGEEKPEESNNEPPPDIG